jgi:hypothetical protein
LEKNIFGILSKFTPCKFCKLDLPTNDDEHKELENTLNGVEKEQLKFIKEFWFSKQIDSTREFEQKT